MRATTEFERKFPKWLIGDSADDRVFVIHLHFPRFVGEVIDDPAVGVSEIRPEFIDDPEGISVQEMARLMREAGDFYADEIERES